MFTEDSPVDESEKLEEDPKQRFKKINWMRAAFTAADKILTVSPNYAEEIMSGVDKGVELNDVLV